MAEKYNVTAYRNRYRMDSSSSSEYANDFWNNENRTVKGICKGAEICLERNDWYRIYLAAGHILP